MLYDQHMESLALLATLILAIAIVGGPLSLLFSWLRAKNQRKHQQPHRTALRIYFVLTIFFGAPALAVGIRLITLDIAISGKFFGLVGIATSAAAFLKLYRSR